ncbi:hypothetical protein [Streptomyces sp. TRM68416]|uniref:hypothetical protein n=1 Tax=Streptomyces sp. TRM68416 TaxID=2758412 RepID=UPI001CB6FCFA|nr:hypothetical protein [Streptomyces sp. TRM68416]
MRGLTEANLKKLAGSRSFDRGRGYLDAVSGVEVGDGWVTASVHGGQLAPAGLTLVTECPPFPQGGMEAIAQWLERNPDARMVVIDVFARMRGNAPQGVSAYDADHVAVG